MSWFTTDNKLDIQRKLERIMNKTVSVGSHVPIEKDVDERFDDRSHRLTPVVLLQLTDQSDCPQITTGLTKDISIEGLGVTTLGTLEPGSTYAVGIGDRDEFTVLGCRCVRSDALSYGYYANGLQVEDILSEVDFVSLKEFAEYLRDNPPQSSLPVAPGAPTEG